MSFNEWHTVSIKDVFELIPGFAFKSKEFSENGIPVIKIKNVKALRLLDREFSYIDPKYLETKSRFTTKKGDLLISMTGNRIEGSMSSWVGKVCRINSDKKYLINQRVGILRLSNEIYSDKFFLYLLGSEEIQKKLISIATSSGGQANISPDQIKSLEFSVPYFEVQNAIADILSTLDEKIEVNNQINKTLENMAQAIFKQWFVDFEFPNEEGEPYKSSGGEMIESELGMIPKGWEVGTLNDIGEIIGGGTPSKSKIHYFAENGIPWITPKDLSNNKNKFIDKGALDISEEGLKNSSAKLMPEGSVLFSSRAPIGYIAIAKNQLTTNQGFRSIVPKELYGSEYVYQLLVSNLEKIESRASGSTFKEISGGELKKIEVVLPDAKVINDFNHIVTNMSKLIAINEDSNKELINIRDSLLPKLMSGEIRVPLDEEGIVS